MIVLRSSGGAIGSINICRLWNWLSWLVSPCCHLFRVVNFLSFWWMKNPRVCSSKVVADDWITSIVNSRRTLGSKLALKDDVGCLSLDIALSNWISNVGTDISMSFSVWQRWCQMWAWSLFRCAEWCAVQSMKSSSSTRFSFSSYLVFVAKSLLSLMRLRTSDALSFVSSAKVIGISSSTPWLCMWASCALASTAVKTQLWLISRTYAPRSLRQVAL